MNKTVLIFEWLCGGGLWHDRTDPADVSGLLDQGKEMLLHLCEDFLTADYELVVPWDRRLDTAMAPDPIKTSLVSVDQNSSIPNLLDSLASTANHTIIVAPETGGRLTDALNWVDKDGHRSEKILNASREFCALATDKNELQYFLQQRGIPVPMGCSYDEASLDLNGDDSTLAKMFHNRPFVLKPADGCGGEDVFRFENLASLRNSSKSELVNHRIEEFVDGIPVSVSVIVGRKSTKLFHPLRQKFHSQADGPGTLLGTFSHCDDDLSPEVAERATKLAEQTLATLTDYFPLGLVGMDCIVGENDVVVELNPRVTMSYGVLRQMSNDNMAQQLVAAFCDSLMAE